MRARTRKRKAVDYVIIVSIFQDVMEMHYDYNRSMVVSISHQRNPVTGVRGNLKVVYDFNTVSTHCIFSFYNISKNIPVGPLFTILCI